MDTLYVRLRPEWVWLCCTAGKWCPGGACGGSSQCHGIQAAGFLRASHGLVLLQMRANPANGGVGSTPTESGIVGIMATNASYCRTALRSSRPRGTHPNATGPSSLVTLRRRRGNRPMGLCLPGPGRRLRRLSPSPSPGRTHASPACRTTQCNLAHSAPSNCTERVRFLVSGNARMYHLRCMPPGDCRFPRVTNSTTREQANDDHRYPFGTGKSTASLLPPYRWMPGKQLGFSASWTRRSWWMCTNTHS